MSLELYNTTRRDIPLEKLERAVRAVVAGEGHEIRSIVAVYCGDRLIHRINREFLEHDYPTDTITFRYNCGREIEGEFYVSLDTIADNARIFGSGFEGELLRVTVHSVLHLAGYADGTDGERSLMREKEERYLAQLQQDHI